MSLDRVASEKENVLNFLFRSQHTIPLLSLSLFLRASVNSKAGLDHLLEKAVNAVSPYKRDLFKNLFFWMKENMCYCQFLQQVLSVCQGNSNVAEVIVEHMKAIFNGFTSITGFVRYMEKAFLTQEALKSRVTSEFILMVMDLSLSFQHAPPDQLCEVLIEGRNYIYRGICGCRSKPAVSKYENIKSDFDESNSQHLIFKRDSYNASSCISHPDFMSMSYMESGMYLCSSYSQEIAKRDHVSLYHHAIMYAFRFQNFEYATEMLQKFYDMSFRLQCDRDVDQLGIGSFDPLCTQLKLVIKELNEALLIYFKSNCSSQSVKMLLNVLYLSLNSPNAEYITCHIMTWFTLLSLKTSNSAEQAQSLLTVLQDVSKRASSLRLRDVYSFSEIICFFLENRCTNFWNQLTSLTDLMSRVPSYLFYCMVYRSHYWNHIGPKNVSLSISKITLSLLEKRIKKTPNHHQENLMLCWFSAFGQNVHQTFDFIGPIEVVEVLKRAEAIRTCDVMFNNRILMMEYSVKLKHQILIGNLEAVWDHINDARLKQEIKAHFYLSQNVSLADCSLLLMQGEYHSCIRQLDQIKTECKKSNSSFSWEDYMDANLLLIKALLECNRLHEALNICIENLLHSSERLSLTIFAKTLTLIIKVFNRMKMDDFAFIAIKQTYQFYEKYLSLHELALFRVQLVITWIAIRTSNGNIFNSSQISDMRKRESSLINLLILANEAFEKYDDRENMTIVAEVLTIIRRFPEEELLMY